MRNPYARKVFDDLFMKTDGFEDDIEYVLEYIETLEKQVDKYREYMEKYEGLYRG